MRPNKLTISAFGPYAGEAVIDFDKLGKNGVYLITGDTGAGKTTIFDAISFALFGSASGSNRENAMLRSKYADPSVPTKVELTFENGGKTYRVERNPEYERAKTRGEGTTKTPANAFLYLPDGKVIAKVKDVDKAVEEILGVDKDQFSQIAMIAQGDFLKLLFASTEERQGIFKKLFKTENYGRLQQKLKEMSAEKEREAAKASESIAGFLKNLLCDAESEHYPAAEKARRGELPTDEVIALLKTLYDTDNEFLKRVDEQVVLADKLIERSLAAIKKGEVYLKAKEEIAANSEEKTAVDRLIGIRRAEMEKFGDYDKTKAAISEGIAAAEAEKKVLDDIFEKEERKKAIERELLSSHENAEKTKLYLSELDSSLKALAEKRDSVKNVRILLSEKNAQKVALDKRSDDCLNIQKGIKELNELRGEYLELRSSYAIYKSEYERARAEHERINQAYLDAQAGILAETLVENEPCPVCGSTAHPSPCVKPIFAPTESELKKAKSIRDEKEKICSDIYERMSKTGASGDTLKKSLNRSINELFAGFDADNVSSELENKSKLWAAEKAAVEKETEELCVYAKSLDGIDGDISHCENERKKAADALTALIAEESADKTKIKEIELYISEKKGKLKYAFVSEAEKSISELNLKKERLEKEYSSVKEDLDALVKRQAELNAGIASAKNVLAGDEIVDFDAEKEKHSELLKERAKLNELKINISSRKNINEVILLNVNSAYKAAQRAEKEWATIAALSDTANGTLSQKEKVTLETYVQTAYFDRIIARANVRFMQMTDGQFELTRRRTADNLRVKVGLDLNVIDHHNRSERSVKTLSGGESFKAALSLALGLSDEIQESAGGIRLESMFVDEGFGSLDEMSLEQAISVLVGLSASDRSVGIISHVEKLKERIDKQILVKKGVNGESSIKIIV